MNNENKKSDKTNIRRKKRLLLETPLSAINERGLSKSNKAFVKNVLGATSEKILEEMNEIIKEKPDSTIIHAGTNDLTNNINLLNRA